MNQEIIETIVLFVGSCWFFYRWVKKKTTSSLFAGILTILFLLSKWPLFFPVKISFSLWAFCAAFFMLFERYRKKQQDQSIATLYIILFVIFGVLFLVEGLST